jgi:hypothetical protein
MHSGFKLLMACTIVLSGCGSTSKTLPNVPALQFPVVSRDDYRHFQLERATGFRPLIDPAYFSEISPEELLDEVTGLMAYSRYSEGWFGGLDTHFWRISERFEVQHSQVYLRYANLNIGGERAELGAERVANIRKALIDMRSPLSSGIRTGKWTTELRRQIAALETYALAQLYVSLKDPGSDDSPSKAIRAVGILPLCINYYNSPHPRWGSPPPARLFIPSSRTTAAVYEIDPKYVPAILDCYKRIVLEVEGEN